MATVNEGRDNIAKLLVAGQTGVQNDSVAIGTGGTAVSDGDTGLTTTQDTSTGLTGSVNGNTMSLVATFTGNTADVREASIYNDTSGTMLARQIISTVSVESSDTLEITWQVDVQDA